MRDQTFSSAAALYQPGILKAVPPAARYLLFTLSEPAIDAPAIKEALTRLAPLVNGSDVVLGISTSLVHALGGEIPGLHELPDLSGHGVKVPSTPGTLWCWLRGSDLGDLLHVTRKVQKALAPAFVARHAVDAFRHAWSHDGRGRDLTGFEDGTENPKGEEAEVAAFANGLGDGLDGSSYVAVQQWVHDPEAFVLRRSMPWLAGMQAGLMFVAFGQSLYAFEAQMRRMAGHDDGIVDAMFKISAPVTGAYFCCPPVRAGQLDLRRLGLGA